MAAGAVRCRYPSRAWKAAPQIGVDRRERHRDHRRSRKRFNAPISGGLDPARATRLQARRDVAVGAARFIGTPCVEGASKKPEGTRRGFAALVYKMRLDPCRCAAPRGCTDQRPTAVQPSWRLMGRAETSPCLWGCIGIGAAMEPLDAPGRVEPWQVEAGLTGPLRVLPVEWVDRGRAPSPVFERFRLKF
jgi:hypothetical protein